MSWRGRKKKSSVLGFLGGMIILFIVFDALLMAWQLTPITAVSKYRHVKGLRWHRQDLVGHFPEKIPPDAKNAVFYYRAGFLQGGSSIELRVHMPEEFVEEVCSTYEPQAKFIFRGAERTEKEPDDPDGPPKATFFTFPLDQHETPREGILLPQDKGLCQALVSSHRPCVHAVVRRPRRIVRNERVKEPHEHSRRKQKVLGSVSTMV